MTNRGTLYQVAALYHPPLKKDMAGNTVPEKATIVLAPQYIVASDETAARTQAIRMVEDETVSSDDLQILVRPF